MTDDTDEWTTEATAPTLRLLYQSGIAVSPAGLAANLDALVEPSPSTATVRETLTALAERRMVRTLDADGDYYLLTDHGRDYVETAIDDTSLGFVD